MSDDAGRKSIPLLGVGDLFIYLLPGATLLLAIAGFEMRAKSSIVMTGGTVFHVPALTALLVVAKEVVASNDKVLTTAFLLGWIAVAYIVGHVTSSLSSFTLDRMLVFKAHGYPYSHLLLPAQKPRGAKNFTQAYYRGIFFWGNALLVAVFLAIVWKQVSVVASVVAFGSFGVVFAGSLAKGYVDSQLRRKGLSTGIAELPPWPRRIARVLSFGYDRAVNVYTDFTRSNDPLSEVTRVRFHNHMASEFGIDSSQAHSDNYWLSYMYVARNAPELQARLTNWLYLYEFARNLSTAFYIAAIWSGYQLAWQWSSVAVGDTVSVRLPLCYLAAACVMMARYYYLYVCYYSKFLFRSFAYMNSRGERQRRKAADSGPQDSIDDEALEGAS